MPLKPALFVEPFGVSGIGPDSMHLVEGFRIELIACLTRFREWYVCRNGGRRTGDDRDARVSDRYGLTTTAYQAGAAINVVMVLQERPSGLAIWGERFELRLDQWFEVAAAHRPADCRHAECPDCRSERLARLCRMSRTYRSSPMMPGCAANG